LIRIYQPNSNTLLKDDKSPLYIQITDETFPRVLKIRKKELMRKAVTGTILGPFPSAYKTSEVLKIARKIFPWCNKKLANEDRRTTDNQPCLFYQIEQCPGACIGKVTPQEYQENIDNLILFLKGKKKSVVKSLQAKMLIAIEQQDYEQAAIIG